MTFWLPLVALLLAVLSRIVFRDRDPLSWKIDGPRSAALVVSLVISAALAALFAPYPDRAALLAGLAVGGFSVWLAVWLGGPVAPLAMGVAGASGLHLLSAATVPTAQLALIAGVGIGALTLGSEDAFVTALAAATCAAGDNLGAVHTKAAGAALLGSDIGLAASIGALAVSWDPKRLQPMRPVAIGALTLAAIYFAGRSVGEDGLVFASGIGALAGIVLHWLLPEEEEDAVRIGIAAVIGVGVATLAFGLGRGAGMALALAAAGGVLLGVRNVRALLTLGPLVGLVMYRVLREQGTGASRALDIGQHYTLLTLLLGAVLPLLPSDWLKREGIARSIGAVLLGLLYLSIPLLTVVVFGMRGGIGFVVGLGFTGLCQALRKEREPMPLALGTGAAGTTILCMTWLSKADELTRDDKVRLLAYSGGGILVVALALVALARTSRKGVEA